MADRTSASIFALVFEFLAEQPDDRAKAFALKLWPERNEFDFSDYQMSCDEALVKLDLATRCDCGAIDYRDDRRHTPADCAENRATNG